MVTQFSDGRWHYHRKTTGEGQAEAPAAEKRTTHGAGPGFPTPQDGEAMTLEEIEEMKAQNERLKSRGFEDLHDENERLRAGLLKLGRRIRAAIRSERDEHSLEVEILDSVNELEGVLG